MKSIPERFFESAGIFGGKVAFRFFREGWKELTYRELVDHVDALSGALLSGGLRKGDRVFLSAGNSPLWCVCYLALSSAGGVAVPVDPELTVPEMRNLLLDAEASFILHDSSTGGKVKEASEGLAVRAFDMERLCRPGEEEPSRRRPPFPSAGDTASIIYTSGTTGRPKGVVLTHGNFCADADAVLEAGIISGEDNVLSVLPLHHTYPFMCTFLVPLLAGATVTYPPGLSGPELLDTIRTRGVTILVGVPQLLELFRNRVLKGLEEVPLMGRLAPHVLGLLYLLRSRLHLNPGRLLFSSVHSRFGRQFRFFTSGGARLEPRVMKDLEALGFTVLEGYGLTETAPVVAFNPKERRKPGSAGKPLSNAEIKIASDGEVLIRGPMVMKGYYRDPEETASALREGWLHTGDLGYMDSDGYLYITGRKKEVIVLSSGKNIYPEDVERHYQTVPLIKELCVLGGDDGLYAVVVPDLERARELKIGNLRQYLRWEIDAVSMKLPSHMRLKGFVIHTGPLPRTPLGKLRRFMIGELLRQRAEERRETDESLLKDRVSSAVVSSIREVTGRDTPVRRTDSLELDLRLDSLKRIELIVALQRNLGMRLPDDFVHDVQTVDELIEKVRSLEGAEERALEAGLLGVEEGEEETAEGLLRQGLHERVLFFILHGLLRLLSRLYFRLEINGAERLPEPPFIIAPNHSSYLDAFLLAAGLPFRVCNNLYFQGARRYFEGPVREWFAHLTHVVPIDPDASLLSALRVSAYLLRKGRCLCIFPEGGRTFDGEVMEFKKGVGMLALELGVPVVPVCIEGTFRSMPRGAAFPKPLKVTIQIGTPVAPVVEEGTADPHQAFADRVRAEVLRMKEEGP